MLEYPIVALAARKLDFLKLLVRRIPYARVEATQGGCRNRRQHVGVYAKCISPPLPLRCFVPLNSSFLAPDSLIALHVFASDA